MNFTNDKIFVDTNVFVYAHVNDGSRKRETAADLLRNRLAGAKIIVSVQVLNEFYSAMSKYKRTHEEITAFMTDIVARANVSDVSLATVGLCLALKAEHGYSYWDSLILASAIETGCTTLFSEDMKDGHTIEMITIRNPFQIYF